MYPCTGIPELPFDLEILNSKLPPNLRIFATSFAPLAFHGFNGVHQRNYK